MVSGSGGHDGLSEEVDKPRRARRSEAGAGGLIQPFAESAPNDIDVEIDGQPPQADEPPSEG